MNGLDIYRTKDGFAVARLHYTADQDKILENGEPTPELLKGYVGGKSGAAWRKEMEIDFTAYSGQLLCYDIIQNYRSKIIQDKYVKATDYKYGSLDWGRNNPSSFNEYAVDENGDIHSCYEIYLNEISIPDFCSLIKQAPHYQELNWISADPSMWNRTQEEKDGVRSLYDKFKDNGINLTKGGSKSDEFAINELLDRWDKLDENRARYTISPKCPKQIWELERLRYQEITTAMVERRNASETLVDKDNHGWDNFKYFISKLLGLPDLTPKEIINPRSAWGEHILNERKPKEAVYGR